MNRRLFAIAFVFVLSGFAGLIYQALWAKHLGLILGHAAYAQALVLGIFMGGMAIGAYAAGRIKALCQPKNLMSYAVIELLVGVAGVLFPAIFKFVSAWLYDSLLPGIESQLLADTAKVAVSAGLILPQCILLGATFPIVGALMVRADPNVSASTLSTLYFANSFGAAFGAFVSAFFLVPELGLSTSVRLAGGISLIVALISIQLVRSERAHDAESAASSEQQTTGPLPPAIWFFLAIAFFTGLSSFVYEITWTRMLALVFGSNVYAFEIMLATFILGLSLGALYIGKRFRQGADPVSVALWAQLLMGAAALLSLLAYDASFEAMRYLKQALARSEEGYGLYLAAVTALSAAVMLPTAFFAGMTLPAITESALREVKSQRSIGFIYAANTLGAIAGVLLTVFVLVENLGLRGALIVGASVDLVLACWIAARAQRKAVRVFAMATALVIGALLVPSISKLELASGVFRYGRFFDPKSVEVQYYADGRTATISVNESKGINRTIATNGKPDASIALEPGKTSGDEETMVIAAGLPLIYAQPKKALVIGFGSGLSTHALLAAKSLERVDTVEIEAVMVEGARKFLPMNARAYEDPRSNIIIDDARTILTRNDAQYDMILSEPSNPWVSGVANLFSKEWYHFVRGKMAKDGIFVQWTQLYEISDPLVRSLQAALLSEFPYAHVYLSNQSDLIIVASLSPLTPRLLKGIPAAEFEDPIYQRVGLNSPGAIAARYIGSQELLKVYIGSQGFLANSDFFPIVEYNAPKTFFMGATPTTFQMAMNRILPINMLDPDPEIDYGAFTTRLQHSSAAVSRSGALGLAKLSASTVFDPSQPSLNSCPEAEKDSFNALNQAAEASLSWLSESKAKAFWSNPRFESCPFDEKQREFVQLIQMLLAGDGQNAETLSKSLVKKLPPNTKQRSYALAFGALALARAGEHARALQHLESENINDYAREQVMFRMMGDWIIAQGAAESAASK